LIKPEKRKEILLRGNLCAYLTCRLMGDLNIVNKRLSALRASEKIFSRRQS
jgi:hypothetical protein